MHRIVPSEHRWRDIDKAKCVTPMKYLVYYVCVYSLCLSNVVMS